MDILEATWWEGFEFKYTDRPASTRSMHIAIDNLNLNLNLNLDRLTVIYPGDRRIPLTEKIEARGLAEFISAGRGGR